MDPTANLREQLALAARMIKAYDDPAGNGIDQDDTARLAELVTALDGWIRRGGFLPEPWRKPECTCCQGAGHAGPCCPGWLHMEEPREIQRCDDCGTYETDEDAAAAHARECGCDWPAR